MMLKTKLPVFVVNSTIVFPSSEMKVDVRDSDTKKLIDLALNYFNGHLFCVPNDIDNFKIGDSTKAEAISKIGDVYSILESIRDKVPKWVEKAGSSKADIG